MTRIDKMLEFMEKADVSCLDIACANGTCKYRGDGTKQPIEGRISEYQIRELLTEIIPAEHSEAFAKSHPIQFNIVRNGTSMQVSASHANGNMSMQIKLPTLIMLEPESFQPSTDSLPITSLEPEDFQPSTSSFIPMEIPLSLRWTERGTKLFSAIIGILMGLAVSVALFALNSKQSLLGQMFNLNSIMALAPISMSCLFFWGVMLCILRWLRLRQAEQVSSKIILSKVTSSLGTTTLSGIMASLSSPGTTISPLLRRVQAIIRQWTIKPSLQDAALLLEHQELSDEDTIRNSYGVVRVFVWALPVLGLIGTVVGIALAVGNFAQFLGTNIDDVSLIKKSLVSVTGGLSYAFMNTLQGLLSSLLLMLPASALQSREERLISTIRRDISDVFLPALQRAFPESTTGDDIRGEKSFRETLVGVSESVLTKVGETTSHIVRQTEEQIKNWSGNLRTETEEGARRLGEVIGKLGKDLETSSNDFLTRLSMIQDSWDRHTSALGQLVEQQVQTNSQIRTDLMKAAEIHFASAENISRSIQGLAETTNTALQAQAVLQASIDKLSQANFNQSLDAVTSALKEVSGQTIIVSQAMNSLVGASQRILDSQQVLQGAVSQLQQMGLTETLVGFTSSLKQVSEVLAKFQEPIVFQAVRVSNILERKA